MLISSTFKLSILFYKNFLTSFKKKVFKFQINNKGLNLNSIRLITKFRKTCVLIFLFRYKRGKKNINVGQQMDIFKFCNTVMHETRTFYS